MFQNIILKIAILITFLITILFSVSIKCDAQIKDISNKLTKDLELKFVKKSIDSLYYYSNSLQYKQILVKIESLSEKKENFVFNYYMGFINLQLGKIVYYDDGDSAYDYFNEAIDLLIEADDYLEESNFSINKQAEYKNEIRVLLSDLYSKKVALSSFSSVYWGIKSKNKIYEAFEKDSLNPKVLLISANLLMYVPERFGGDKKKAKIVFEKSLKMRATIKNDDLLLDWADSSELYSQMVKLELINDNKDKAKIYLDSSISVFPNSYTNKKLLIDINARKKE